MGNPIQSLKDSFHQNNLALSLLQGVNQQVMSSGDLEATLAYLARETAVFLETAECRLWLLSEEGQDKFICRAIFPQTQPAPSIPPRLQASEKNAARITAKGTIVAPLWTEEELIGILEFINPQINDLETAQTVANATAVAIVNARFITELQEQNKSLDAFAHSVAHDLQNPLARIVGFAELLQFKYDDLNEEERQYVLNALSANANRMSRITQGLLLLAIVRKTDVEVEPLSMQKIVFNAMENLSNMVGELSAEFSLPDEWPEAVGYAPWIEEVWVNYLSNGLKYGGEPPHLKLGGTIEANGMARFWVRDNGRGFTPDEREQLFAPFTKLRKANGNGNSYGLGLSIVRQIVEKLGGTVNAECVEDEGSTFSFTLPSGEIGD